jgi:hypothetical protein
MRTFDSDLELGHRAEEYILEKLQLLYPTMRSIKVKNVDYDLIDDNETSVEVKLDIKSKETGRVAIEYMHRGKPSGISISKSTLWVIIYFLEDEWVWSFMETDLLRKYIKRNHAKHTRYIGDGDKSSLLLINSLDIANEFGYYKIEKKISYNNIPD